MYLDHVSFIYWFIPHPFKNFFLKDCVGTIDGTHIPAFVPSGQQMAYTNRHGVQSQNVLTVCDKDIRFVYVYAG